jgi:hypothetical protein
MSGAIMSRTIYPVLMFAITLLATVTSVSAQPVCVVCERPSASYRCLLDPHVPVAEGKKARRLLTLACIQDIAKRYGHESCGVRRGAVGPCIGEDHTITLTAPNPNAPRSPYEARSTKPPAEQKTAPQPTKARKKEGPPETVAELAEKAGKDSEKQLQKAGKAVGRAVRKTWRCVTSLFGDC